jgi:hypothetical protein
LDHGRIYEDQTDLEQMQREHGDLLILSTVGGDLAATTVKNKSVGAVPANMGSWSGSVCFLGPRE